MPRYVRLFDAGLFFIAFPVVAFFLLHGGGLDGFGDGVGFRAARGLWRRMRRDTGADQTEKHGTK